MKEIYTENPKTRWEFVNVDQKRVLDLGCGRPWALGGEEAWERLETPEYFLEMGADFVIGIDDRPEEIEYFKSLFRGTDRESNVFFEEKQIQRAEDVKDLITRFEPDCIKCDIEGKEILLEDLEDYTLSLVSEYYIETHSDFLHQVVKDKLESNDFLIREEILLGHAPQRDNRVIFAFKEH